MIDFIPRHLRPNESWGEKRSNNESTPLLIYKPTSQLDNDSKIETTCTTVDVSPLPSYGNCNDTPSLSSSSENGNTGLKGENKRLKAEIQQLRAQVVQLRKNKKGGPKPVPGNRGRTLDRIAARFRNCRSLSSGPATDRSEADPCLPLEIHESAAGLHHRRHPENSGRALEFVNLHREEDDIEDDEDITSIGLGDYDHSNDVEAQDRRRYRNNDGDVDNDDHLSFSAVVVDRAGWLVGLLILQSLSSFIIKRNEALLQDHAVIVQFLTMLVGAGGNAGNQASVKGMLPLVHFQKRLYNKIILIPESINFLFCERNKTRPIGTQSLED